MLVGDINVSFFAIFVVIVFFVIFWIVAGILKKTIKFVLPRRYKKYATFLLFVFLTVFIYMQYDIDVTRYDVKLLGLPKDKNNYRIVQLSDVHIDDNYNFIINNARKIIDREDADLVVITGDFISSKPEDFETGVQAFNHLKSKDGTFVVLGNHDYYNVDSEHMKKVLDENGMILLDNSNKKLDDNFYIAGVEDFYTAFPNVKKAIRGIDNKDALVFLSHVPNIISKLPNRDMLLLTGHTHGGQICIPFIDRSKLPGLLGEKYISGFYKEKKINMYVNRGIGFIKPAIRLFSRPEITVFTLKMNEE